MNFGFREEKSKPALEQFAINMNQMVKENKLNRIIGREDEIRRVIEILTRKEKNNPVLIGQPGVGKTAIVEGFVQKIIANEVPDNLKDCVVYELNAGALIAGAKFMGEFESRITQLIKELTTKKQTVVLFIDEIHQLMGLGASSENKGMDAANLLKPLMARGQIKIIGATTLDEYRNYIEKDGAFTRRVQKILVDEPTSEQTLTMLRGLKEKWEIFHNVRIMDNALVAAVKLSERYITNMFLPDKAIDLIDEAAAQIKAQAHSIPKALEDVKNKIFYLETEKIALESENNEQLKPRIEQINDELNELKKKQTIIISEWEKQKAQQNEITSLKQQIEEKNRLVEKHQNLGEFTEASKLLYTTLPKLKKELEAKEKLINSNKDLVLKDFVSDLDIAKIVARATKIDVDKIFEGDTQKLVNLKQNLLKEIKGQDEAIDSVVQTITINKLGINDEKRPIGSFLFVGSSGVGKTELAKALANSLFDSQKALVQINMSEYMEKHSVSRLIGSAPGYIGYNQGGELTEQIRHKPYCVILLDEIEKAHSDVLNLLLQVLEEGTLKDNHNRLVNFKNTIIIMTSNVGSEAILKKDNIAFESMLKKSFRPEFLNRIDDIVKFNVLDEVQAYKIVEKLLNQLKTRLEQNHYLVDFDKSVIQHIINIGFSNEYGARNFKRAIHKNLEVFIANQILDKTIVKNKLAKINYFNNHFSLNALN